MKNNKSNLDEMQEAKLLKIEHNGCWIAFWGLLAAMIVELFVFDAEEMGRAVLGEWIVFMVLAVYIGAACLKNGIWDRRLKADRKTNLTVSLISALAAAAVLSAVALVRYHSPRGALGLFVLCFVFTFVITFLTLSLTARSYRKHLDKLESESDEQESENN